VANLRPESGPETEYVSFDRPCMLRALARIIGDLDDQAGFPTIAEEDVKKGGSKPGAPATGNGWRRPTRRRSH
jgi:hypothetical protein